MTVAFYPESGLPEPEYGALVSIAGDGVLPGSMNATMAILRELCEAEIHVGSGTSLAARCSGNAVYADNDEDALYPIFQMSVNAFQSAADAANGQMRVYVGILLDRDPAWPTIAEDQLLLDTIFGAMA